ncbi:MAG: hypothetical protein WBD47_15450 [Phormidesmis sp.]
MTQSQDSQNSQPPAFSITDFSFEPENSTPVISAAYKFVIPVPALGESAEPLVYPKDHPKARQPILDYQGEPIGDRGIVFFNEKDQAYQAAPADGTGVIMINEVSVEQAAQLEKKVHSLAENVEGITFEQLKKLLDYARLELGLGDIYNSTRTYVAQNLTSPIPKAQRQDQTASQTKENLESISESSYGLKQRNKKDIYRAIYIPGEFLLEGATATAQVFKNGGVILEQQGERWGIQPNTFVNTYRLENGDPITTLSEDIATTDTKSPKSSASPV